MCVDPAYNSDGALLTLTAKNPTTGDQVTRYVYGTDAGGITPAVYRNDLLRAEIYPDSDDTTSLGNGRAGLRTCEDMEAARRTANEYHYPHGRTHFTPDQLWQSRAAIDYTERAEFRLAVERALQEQRQKRECSPEEQPPAAALLAAEYRRAVRQALVELGILTTRWRSITLPIKLRKSAKIS
jgi:hypothetical protein